MRTLAILSILTAAAIGLHYGGIVNFDPAVDRVVQIAEKVDLIEKEPRNEIIGLDITAGREAELDKDREAIGKRVEGLRAGDQMTVYLIHSRAESDQEAIFSITMPENSGPAGRVLVRGKKAAEQAWNDCWEKSVTPLIKSDKAQRTDLFGFMRFVATQKPDFMSHHNAALILFTDGQQVGDGFNMERKAPSKADLERALGKELIPDLEGIRLYFVGVTPTHKIDNAHWRKLQTFWKEYGKEANAKSVSVSSERSINSK